MRLTIVAAATAAIAIFAPGQSAHAQHVIYVNASAAGTNDGTSWQNAFNDLQDGLDVATAAADCPCEVWVAGGVYKPDRGTGDRTMAFELVNDVGLYGGFAGWESRLDQRLPGANETILSGDLDDNDDPEPTTDIDCCSEKPTPGCEDPVCFAKVEEELSFFGEPSRCTDGWWSVQCAATALRLCCDICRPTRCDNTYNIVRAMETDASAILDGVAVTGAEANGTERPFVEGGGLNARFGDPTVRDCRFVNNAGWQNSVILAADSTLVNTVVVDNLVYNGGDCVHLSGDVAVHIESCLFARNHGNAVSISGNSTIRNSDFVDNDRTGLITGSSSTTTEVSGCRFIGNMHRGMDTNGITTLVDCAFIGNSHGWRGGGLNSELGQTHLVNCLFSGNRAGGGVSFPGNPPAVGFAGAFLNTFAVAILENCTFIRNSAGNVAGVWTEDFADVTNCVFWENCETDGNCEQLAQLQGFFDGTIEVDYSIIQNWTGELGGVGNSGVDPLFVDPLGPDGVAGTEDDNPRLSADSPAINAGMPSNAVPGFTDLDGHPRVLCGRADIGAYEFGLGDYDCDRVIDLYDFQGWDGCMTGPGAGPDAGPYDPGCEAFDANADGNIDLADWSSVLSAFDGL